MPSPAPGPVRVSALEEIHVTAALKPGLLERLPHTGPASASSAGERILVQISNLNSPCEASPAGAEPLAHGEPKEAAAGLRFQQVARTSVFEVRGSYLVTASELLYSRASFPP